MLKLFAETEISEMYERKSVVKRSDQVYYYFF